VLRADRKLIFGLNVNVENILLSYNTAQSRVVIGLFIKHYTLRIYHYLMGLTKSPFCVRAKLWLYSDTGNLAAFLWTQTMLKISRLFGHV
jgi:hypothetical protein